MNGEEGRRWEARGPTFGAERLEASGWGGPNTVVLLLELIVFYFSTLLCFVVC